MKETIIFLLLLVSIFVFFNNKPQKEVIKTIEVPVEKEVQIVREVIQEVEKIVEKPVYLEKEVIFNHYWIRGVRGYVLERNGIYTVVDGWVSEFQSYFPGKHLRGGYK
jgi:hypothetical protein